MFCTRFAPSPTGPLHIGHAYSALVGVERARAEGGRFLLRMEDLDRERSKPHWEALIHEDLTWLGIKLDGPVLRQSDHLPRYEAALARLIDLGLVYPCGCTRADIRAALAAPQEGASHTVYPGTCRGRSMASRTEGDALRLDLARALTLLDRPLSFVEEGAAQAGTHTLDPARAMRDIGDVVLARKGEVVAAYFMASAVDDAFQNVTHVVRGEDLFDFTPLQVILLALLELPQPIYHHHGLIRDAAGKRLAKRDDAKAISKFRAEGVTPAELRAMVGL